MRHPDRQRRLADTALACDTSVIAAALRTRGAAAPVPPAGPGTPGYRTAAMITCPDPDAGKDENTTLERLARLRAAVAGPQPVTAAEVRAAIRRWLGDRLPDHVRALGSPAKMRAWIDDQVTDRVGRPAPVTYDNPGAPGGRWYSASPEGLLTGVVGDDRAETLIRWEEIPAWTQPGITTSLRDRLLSADDTCRKGFRRRLTAAVHPHSGVDVPNGQEDEQSARHLREAITAAWAAIDAAPVARPGAAGAGAPHLPGHQPGPGNPVHRDRTGPAARRCQPHGRPGRRWRPAVTPGTTRT